MQQADEEDDKIEKEARELVKQLDAMVERYDVDAIGPENDFKSVAAALIQSTFESWKEQALRDAAERWRHAVHAQNHITQIELQMLSALNSAILEAIEKEKQG